MLVWCGKAGCWTGALIESDQGGGGEQGGGGGDAASDGVHVNLLV
jgi:hypothetical protein